MYHVPSDFPCRRGRCSCGLDQNLLRTVWQGHMVAQYLTGQANRLLEDVSRADCSSRLRRSDGLLEQALAQALQAELNVLSTCSCSFHA